KKSVLDPFDHVETFADLLAAAIAPGTATHGAGGHDTQPMAVQVNQGIAPAAGVSTVGSATVVTTGGITFDLNFTAAAM
ncbi:hypothetical protein ACO1MN_16500, partial [Staphylococcus aureus]